MGLHYSSNNIKEIYLGNTPIKEAYLGNVLVYKKNIEPSEIIICDESHTLQNAIDNNLITISQGLASSTIQQIINNDFINYPYKFSIKNSVNFVAHKTGVMYEHILLNNDLKNKIENYGVYLKGTIRVNKPLNQSLWGQAGLGDDSDSRKIEWTQRRFWVNSFNSLYTIDKLINIDMNDNTRLITCYTGQSGGSANAQEIEIVFMIETLKLINITYK